MDGTGVDDEAQPADRRGNAYELFILVLTVYSLAIMAALLLPNLAPATSQLLTIYDNLICLVFLGDFVLRMKQAPSKREYFFRQRGFLDLLGSIPTFGFFRYAALLRLARLSRLARITRLLRRQHKEELVRDLVENRAQYAVLVTLLASFLVLTLSGVLVLQFESHSSDANITTGGEALWWSIVTLTTVGYGDYFPTSMGGRLVAAAEMVVGVGIIASLASILARVMIPTGDDTAAELQGMRHQLDELRSELQGLRQDLRHRPSAEPDEDD